MRGHSVLKCALAGAAIAAVLAAGFVSVGYAAPAAPSAGAGQTDTEPPPETTTPAPDPAPPAPKPTPKPAPKAAPKPAAKPAPVHHAPVHQSTPTPQPTYTPPPVQHVTKKPVHRARKHKRARHVATTPKAKAQVKPANVVKVSGVPTAAVTPTASDAVRRSLIITGMGLAALLFLLVFAVPATGARFTPPGRVLMDHQTDLVLVGVAILVLTALLFAVTS
jgi:outer membrane biosynthesis protein TonB